MQSPQVVGQTESTSFRNLEFVPKFALSAFVVRDSMHTKRDVNVDSLIRMGGTQTHCTFGAIQ